MADEVLAVNEQPVLKICPLCEGELVEDSNKFESSDALTRDLRVYQCWDCASEFSIYFWSITDKDIDNVEDGKEVFSRPGQGPRSKLPKK